MTVYEQPMKPASVLRPRLAVTALFLANGSGIGLWAASIAPIKLLHGLTDFQLSLALLAFAIGAILTMTMTGHIAARFGSARVALLTGLAFAVAIPIPALMPSLVTLALAILAFGACNGAMDVAMNGHGAVVERLTGKPIMSSFHAAFSLGCLLGSAAGSALLAAGFGPLATMGCAGGWALLLTLVTASSLPVPETGPREPAVAFALPSRAALLVGALAFLCMFAEGAVADWSGVYLVSAAGVSTAVAAWGYSGFAFAMTIGRLLGDRIVHGFGAARVVAAGAAIAVLGLGITLALPRVDVAILGYALAGIGIANIIPVLFSAGGRAVPSHPGIGVAMAATCGYAGFLLSPPLIGVFADVLGLRVALIALAVALLIVALAAPRVLGGTGPSLDRPGS
ncbi:MFS transporter [Dongia sedimenti]|uniref:MFS transporter n=1 Tax=Dongia sedimenti TaxID=3064282 RepID=A0ABU0YUT9_9PROT|nr:MFS transporter [Rhodospirillaceae bacterium R-7]